MKVLAFDIAPGVFPVSILSEMDDGRHRRHCVTPDDDISGLPAAARDAITAHWAAMDLGEWQAIAHPPVVPPSEAEIGMEAERRILKVMPEWKQRNLTARGVELLQARVLNGRWSPEDAAEAAAIQAQWDRVKAIRARSDELEQTLPIDFTADQHWAP